MVDTNKLEQIGYSKEQAVKLINMSPLDRLRNLAIVGNAWSDGPLFEVVHELVSSPEIPEIFKWEALVKNSMAVGLPYPADADPAVEIQNYLEACEQ